MSDCPPDGQPQRATHPACSLFGSCGGCSFQDIAYAEQLAAKHAQILRVLPESAISVFHGDPYGYRNRVDMVFHEGGLGFREKGRWYRVVDVSHCPISNAGINALISEIREHFSGIDVFHLKKKVGTYRFALIRATPIDSAISFVLNEESPNLEEAREKIRKFSEHTTARHILVTLVSPNSGSNISERFEIVKGAASMKDSYLGRTFHFSIQGFFQTNSAMAEEMHRYVHSVLEDHASPERTLLDLYGGVGTFGILNAPLFGRMFTVENFAGCVASAIENITTNGLTGASAHCLDAKDVTTLPLGDRVVMVLDPPRSGMHPSAKAAIVQVAPEVIIFVSCNPKILGEELSAFPDYEVRRVAIFDLFPQTPHSETVIELVRRCV